MKRIKVGTFTCKANLMFSNDKISKMKRALNLHWIGSEECCVFNKKTHEFDLKVHENNEENLNSHQEVHSNLGLQIDLEYDLMSDGKFENFRVYKKSKKK